MVESMKILHIIAGAEQGGAESCAVDTIRALHDAGIEQTVISRPHKAFRTLVKDCAIDHHILSFNRVLKWAQKAKINVNYKERKARSRALLVEPCCQLHTLSKNSSSPWMVWRLL